MTGAVCRFVALGSLCVAALLVALGVVACGGSDEAPGDARLETYLDGAGPAMEQLYGALGSVPEITGGTLPPAEAVERTRGIARGYEEARRRMATLDPPPAVGAEHSGLLDSLAVTAREYDRLASALAQGPDALDRIDSTGLDRAGEQLRSWARATRAAARRAGIAEPDWLQGLGDAS